MILYSDSICKVSIQQMKGQYYIAEEWSGILSGKSFRASIMKTLSIYEKQVPELKKEATKFLLYADTSGINMIADKEIDWLNTEINPIYERLGFTHQAVIMPASFFAQQPVKNYEGVSPSGHFTTNLFPDQLSALRWFFK
jgi:hypothetical protein